MKSPHILLVLMLAVFSNCQKSEPIVSSQPIVTYDEAVAAAESVGIPFSQFGFKRDWNGVLAIAAMYGLQDTFRDQERINNSLMRNSEEQLHNYFKSQKEVYDARDQRLAYMKKGQHIQSLSDYFNLMDSLPLYRIHFYPSDEEYAALKKKYFASNYQFFINEAVSGSNNHVPPYLIVVTKPDEMPQEKARHIAKR